VSGGSCDSGPIYYDHRGAGARSRTRCGALKAKERAGRVGSQHAHESILAGDLGDGELTTATRQSEKTTARKDQAGKPRTGDGAWNRHAATRDSVVETEPSRCKSQRYQQW
jgi:hypothetical protein